MKYLTHLCTWLISAGLASFSGTVNDENEDSASEDNPIEASLDDFDDGDKSYLVNEEELEGIKVGIINGDKPDSKWLVVDDIYICHHYQGSEDETFWECSGR
jgi:hypothetical protein